MRDLNQWHGIGRLCADPVIKYTTAGTPVCNFSIANNQGIKEKPEVNFFEIVVWGNMASVQAWAVI